MREFHKVSPTLFKQKKESNHKNQPQPQKKKRGGEARGEEHAVEAIMTYIRVHHTETLIPHSSECDAI
jgi:hypothetical protein